jgi:prepilin-type processing-associated H-X9-DG protein
MKKGLTQTHVMRGFALVELLVVIGIMAVVIGLLLPTLAKARQAAARTVCLANLKSLGVAFVMYANDNSGRLPPVAYGTSEYTLNYGLAPWWHQAIASWMGRKDANASFGYNGATPPQPLLPCPLRDTDTFYQQSYSVNYPGVFAWWVQGDTFFEFSGSAKLSKVPATVFLAADGRDNFGRSNSIINNPTTIAAWALDTDTDGDGINDSASGEIRGPSFGVGPYNGLYPIHGTGANFLFADGSARWISRSSWAKNEGGIWGAGDGSYR